MRFRVIDNKTGKEADTYEIALHEEWAQGLVYCDMEGFVITENGDLMLADECGNIVYCDPERFKVVFEEERPHGEWKEFTVSTYRGTDDWGEPKWGKGKKCICSRCGRRTVIRENFCPSCGSDNRPKVRKQSPCDHCIDDSDCERCDVPLERR